MNLRDNVIIPHHWTSEEASTILRFLYQIADAIWEVHGDGVSELCARANHETTYEPTSRPSASLNDDFPF